MCRGLQIAGTFDIIIHMNLLFFDIECASVYKTTAKICAFGYVLCDENFNILCKEDILINPKGRFHLTGAGNRGITLPYEYKKFKEYPPFTQVYPRIKELLEDRRNAVFGHATHNDVKYLELETNRFKLPSFNFEFSDSQLMYMTATEDFTRQFGLEYITSQLGVEFTPHRAADDAYATMRVVQALCVKYGCNVSELEQKLGIVRGRVRGHRIIQPTSEKFSQYREKTEREKKERSERRVRFYIHLSRCKKRKGGKLAGKVFNFSRPLEDDTDSSLALVDEIYANGGTYTQRQSQCNVYVREEGDTTVRTKNAENAECISVISPVELKELLYD